MSTNYTIAAILELWAAATNRVQWRRKVARP
jgi:hypothetical protein